MFAGGAANAKRSDAVTRLRLVLQGKPIPYVRMTRRGKFVNPRAQAYLSSKDALALQMRAQMQQEPLGREPLRVVLRFKYTRGADHRRDLDNEVKAVLDAANGVVWEDDRWVDEIMAWRGDGAERDEIEMIVETMEHDNA